MIPLLLLGLGHAREMTLTEVLAAASLRPSHQANALEAKSAKRNATAAWMNASLPAIGGQYNITRRSDEIGYDLPPLGFLPNLREDEQTAGAQLDWLLLDPDAWTNARAASANAQAQDDGRMRSQRDTQLEAASAWFDALLLQTRTDATQAYVEALTSQVDRVSAAVDAGSALKSDLLRAQVALTDAKFGLAQLRRGQEVAADAVAWRVGETEPVIPVLDTSQLPELPDLAAAQDTAKERRPELAQLKAAIKALKRQKTSVWAEALPELGAYAGLYWTNDPDVNVDQWNEVGAKLNWVPAAKGTRPVLASAAGLRVKAAEARLQDTSRAIEVAVHQAWADLDLAIQEVGVRQINSEQADEAARILRQRYENDLATMTDLLLAEAELREAKANEAAAKVRAQRADLALDHATGAPLGS